MKSYFSECASEKYVKTLKCRTGHATTTDKTLLLEDKTLSLEGLKRTFVVYYQYP